MDLDVLAREVLSEFHAIHPDLKLEFHSEGDLRGYWDPDRLAQVLSNLVGNALQHGDCNRPVGVGARVEAEEVVIDVHNEGSPIPDALLANIFEPMVRHARGNEDNEARSLSLGLHIVREVVVAHGGTVTVRFTDSGGTTFSVRLPRRAATTPVAHAPGDRPDQHDASGGLVVQ